MPVVGQDGGTVQKVEVAENDVSAFPGRRTGGMALPHFQ